MITTHVNSIRPIPLGFVPEARDDGLCHRLEFGDVGLEGGRFGAVHLLFRRHGYALPGGVEGGLETELLLLDLTHHEVGHAWQGVGAWGWNEKKTHQDDDR